MHRTPLFNRVESYFLKLVLTILVILGTVLATHYIDRHNLTAFMDEHPSWAVCTDPLAHERAK